jgi:glycosyltransferase involved in cell wall biosynthesis
MGARAQTRPLSPDRPRVLFIGNSTFDLPLSRGLARKWDALSDEVDLRVIARAGTLDGPDPRFRLVRPLHPALRGASFYGTLPLLVARELRRFRPHTIVTQSPFETLCALPARAALRSRVKLITELHGDWRTAARLYGSTWRRLYAGLADSAAVLALRRSDATRAVSGFTAGLAERATGRTSAAVFPTYFDIESFTREAPRPLPTRPAVAWIGVLERYKNPRLLADAWRLVAPRVPGARLVVVGRGHLQPIVDDLVREFPDRVEAITRLSPPEVAALLDDSIALALSSESEGLPRVIMEAFARGRAVVATSVGGIPDIVEPDRNGFLVHRGDAPALADALVRILGDGELAERLGRGARETARDLEGTPDRYAASVRRLVEQVLAET